MMRSRKSVLFNIIPCMMLNLPASSFATFSEGLTYSFEGPFRGSYFDLEDAFIFFPLSTSQRKKAMFHCPGSAISVRTTPYLLQVLFGRKLSLSVALCPFLFFLFRHPSKTLSLSLLPRESTPTFLVCTGLSPAFSIVFHDAPSSPRLLSTANSSKVQLLLPANFRCNTADTDWPCRTLSHHR